MWIYIANPCLPMWFGTLGGSRWEEGTGTT